MGLIKFFAKQRGIGRLRDGLEPKPETIPEPVAPPSSWEVPKAVAEITDKFLPFAWFLVPVLITLMVLFVVMHQSSVKADENADMQAAEEAKQAEEEARLKKEQGELEEEVNTKAEKERERVERKAVEEAKQEEEAARLENERRELEQEAMLAKLEAEVLAKAQEAEAAIAKAKTAVYEVPISSEPGTGMKRSNSLVLIAEAESIMNSQTEETKDEPETSALMW